MTIFRHPSCYSQEHKGPQTNTKYRLSKSNTYTYPINLKTNFGLGTIFQSHKYSIPKLHDLEIE